MARPSSTSITFTNGFVVRKGFTYVLTEEEGNDGKGQATALMLKWIEGKWQNVMIPFHGLIGIEAVRGPETERAADMTIVSVEGDYIRAGSAHAREVGSLDPGPDGPPGKGWIRSLRGIGERLYAVGMSRQVYERGSDDKWRHIDGDLLAGPVKDPKKVAGLNDIDGFSGKELYAAGLKGEIWRFDGKLWHSVHSPTNVQLNAVTRIGDFIYIVGGSGVVLRGRGDNFEVLATQDDEENLYAVEAFADGIFVATLRELFVLKDDVLAKVRTGLRGDITTGSLHSADGVMWSVGAKHLVVTEDGSTWTQMFV